MSFVNKLLGMIENGALKAADAATETKRTIRQVEQLIAGSKSAYNDTDAQPGDIFFHYYGDLGVTHGNMVSIDRSRKVDATPREGVRIVPLSADRHPRIGFRLMDSLYAQEAALLATSWVSKVGYSSALGGAARQIHAGFGASNFGRGAVGRIHKYAARGKDGGLKGPKNSTCGELCILAYQLCIPETNRFFPKLDAKHSSPNRIVRFLLENPESWDFIGYRDGVEKVPEPQPPAQPGVIMLQEV